jgi:transposase
MFVIGCDVSKKKLELALLLSLEPLKLRSKVVDNHQPGCMALIDWACRQANCGPGELHVVMEATGAYHEAAAYALSEAGVKVSVVNPAQVREFAKGIAVRNKTDASDRAVLARYGATVKPPLWQPPAPAVVELKGLLNRLQVIETDLGRESNRLEKAQVSVTPRVVLDSLHKSLAFLEHEKRELEKRINDHIEGHPQLKHDRELLESIPAIGRKTACRMLCVLHSRPFRAAASVAAYLGLVPVQHQSGTSVYRPPRLSKAGDAAMRAALYMPAVVASRINPDIRAHYQRLLAQGKSKMSALGAAMRKLVHICFGVLKNQRPYQPRLATTHLTD